MPSGPEGKDAVPGRLGALGKPWIDDTPLALFADLDTASPQQWYVHPDHLDRPTKMTDASQAVVWDAYYWPYGEVRSITGSASNNLRFPGQYFLVESGLHYKARCLTRAAFFVHHLW